MFNFCIYEIKSPEGKVEKGYYFGIWGAINSFADTSEISDSQFLEWAERLRRGAAVNYRGYVIRMITLPF